MCRRTDLAARDLVTARNRSLHGAQPQPDGHTCPCRGVGLVETVLEPRGLVGTHCEGERIRSIKGDGYLVSCQTHIRGFPRGGRRVDERTRVVHPVHSIHQNSIRSPRVRCDSPALYHGLWKSPPSHARDNRRRADRRSSTGSQTRLPQLGTRESTEEDAGSVSKKERRRKGDHCW
jgi:hypothetical protein